MFIVDHLLNNPSPGQTTIDKHEILLLLIAIPASLRNHIKVTLCFNALSGNREDRRIIFDREAGPTK